MSPQLRSCPMARLSLSGPWSWRVCQGLPVSQAGRPHGTYAQAAPKPGRQPQLSACADAHGPGRWVRAPRPPGPGARAAGATRADGAAWATREPGDAGASAGVATGWARPGAGQAAASHAGPGSARRRPAPAPEAPWAEGAGRAGPEVAPSRPEVGPRRQRPPWAARPEGGGGSPPAGRRGSGHQADGRPRRLRAEEAAPVAGVRGRGGEWRESAAPGAGLETASALRPHVGPRPAGPRPRGPGRPLSQAPSASGRGRPGARVVLKCGGGQRERA